MLVAVVPPPLGGVGVGVEVDVGVLVNTRLGFCTGAMDIARLLKDIREMNKTSTMKGRAFFIAWKGRMGK